MPQNADIAVASPQSATRPAATRPACLTRRSPACSSHRWVIDFPLTYAAQQRRPAAGHAMVFIGQQIHPQSVPFPGPKLTKGEKILYHPNSIPHCQISSPCIKPRRRYRLQKILRTELQTVNDMPRDAYRHCGVKSMFHLHWNRRKSRS